MQPKTLILLAAALQSANVLAAPVAALAGTYALTLSPFSHSFLNIKLISLVDASAVAFNAEEKRADNQIYGKFTLQAKDDAEEEEKRDAKNQIYPKLTLSAKDAAEEKAKRQTEFRGAQYAHLYKEAADAGLAETKEKRQTQFRGAQYARLYREAADAGLAAEQAKEKRGVAEAEDAALVERDAQVNQIYKPVLLRKEDALERRDAEKEQIYSLGVLRKDDDAFANAKREVGAQTYGPRTLDAQTYKPTVLD